MKQRLTDWTIIKGGAVPAFQTADAMDELCSRFLDAWESGYMDKLVLIPIFILDFLCIHPFNEGNVTKRHQQQVA